MLVTPIDTFKTRDWTARLGHPAKGLEPLRPDKSGSLDGQGRLSHMIHLQLWQDDSLLRLILAFSVGIAGFADFVGLEEDDLAEAFVRVDTRWKRRGVRDFKRDEPFPLRLERSDVDNDAAAGIGALSDADRQYAARNLEIFDRARQSEGVWRDDADVRLYCDEGFFVEFLRID